MARLAIAWLTLLATLLTPVAGGAVEPLPRPAHAQETAAAPRDLDQLAGAVIALHAANGGSTVNLYDGDLSGRPLYAVVVFPELSEAVPGRALSAERVRAFAERHLALLLDPRQNVGSWYDDAADVSWLDVTTATPDREQALHWARTCNQQSVFDLQRLESIAVGGTGEVPPGPRPWHERLAAETGGGC